MLWSMVKAGFKGDLASARVSARRHCNVVRELWRSSRGAA
jgi:hypothetical protein